LPGQDTPSDWLTANRDLLPHGGDGLDLASGRGRHALWLASRGFAVVAADRDARALSSLATVASDRGVSHLVHAREVDLESGHWVFGVEAFDVVVGFHYLHRPLFPSLVASLRPGGVLVYETFTTAQAARGKPTNPAFLLQSGELVALVQPLDVLRVREGEFEGRDVAGVVARKRA
jgi:SAM-dependent methyltransferase